MSIIGNCSSADIALTDLNRKDFLDLQIFVFGLTKFKEERKKTIFIMTRVTQKGSDDIALPMHYIYTSFELFKLTKQYLVV